MAFSPQSEIYIEIHMMDAPFWNKEIETAERSRIEQIQLERLKQTVAWALKTPFYKKRLTQVGIHSPEDIRSLQDLQRIPYTTKDDLRLSFPKGLLAVEMKEVLRIHSSSGTTGIPTVIYFTRDDVENWTDLLARSIVGTGATDSDVFQNMMTYGMFTGGLGLHYGAERVGMTVIPIGGGNTKRQIQTMKDFQTTVVHVTPSYLLHIHSQLGEDGIERQDLSLRKAFIGAEPHSENTRRKLEELLQIDAYNSYGLSELNGPGVAFECVCKKDMHVWEDAYIAEIINPKTGEVLKEGEKGELVLTNLVRRATPILRYRTRDLAFLLPAGLRLRPDAPAAVAHPRPHRRHAHHQRGQCLPVADRREDHEDPGGGDQLPDPCGQEGVPGPADGQGGDLSRSCSSARWRSWKP